MRTVRKGIRRKTDERASFTVVYRAGQVIEGRRKLVDRVSFARGSFHGGRGGGSENRTVEDRLRTVLRARPLSAHEIPRASFAFDDANVATTVTQAFGKRTARRLVDLHGASIARFGAAFQLRCPIPRTVSRRWPRF